MRTQLRAWPRIGAVYDLGGGVVDPIGNDEIPVEVAQATYEAVLQELISPGSLQPVVAPNRTIKKVKVEGAVDVEFANTDNYDQVPVLTSVEGILVPLLSNVNYGSGLFARAYRV